MTQSARGQVINKRTYIVVQLILCNGFIDDGLKVRGSIARAKREDHPHNKVLFCVTTQFLHATWFNWYLPKTGEQVHQCPNALVANLEHHISYIRDRKTASFGAEVQRPEVND